MFINNLYLAVALFSKGYRSKPIIIRINSGCIRNEAGMWPDNNNLAALVSPQAGQGIPNIITLKQT
jgi:hypothetical protein